MSKYQREMPRPEIVMHLGPWMNSNDVIVKVRELLDPIIEGKTKNANWIMSAHVCHEQVMGIVVTLITRHGFNILIKRNNFDPKYVTMAVTLNEQGTKNA